jgi:hypothetical protein
MIGHFGRNVATFFDVASVDDETMTDFALQRNDASTTDAAKECAESWFGV